MGKTWSSTQRKKYGKRKTRDHRTRASFKGRNTGVRLRTLSVDIADFQQENGEGAVPLYVTTTPKSEFIADPYLVVTGVGKTERQLESAYAKKLNGIGQRRKSLYDPLTMEELLEKEAFLKKQLQFVTTLARGFIDAEDRNSAEKIQRARGTYQRDLNALLLYLERFR